MYFPWIKFVFIGSFLDMRNRNNGEPNKNLMSKLNVFQDRCLIRHDNSMRHFPKSDCGTLCIH